MNLFFASLPASAIPGREYEETRHNAGFMIVDRLAQRAGIPFRIESKWNAAIATTGGVILCKPASFMNLSGEPIAAVARFYKIRAGANPGHLR